MILEFSEWIANHKDEVFKCYGEKKTGFKNSCNGDEQTLEHIQLHDLETAQKYTKTQRKKKKAKKKNNLKRAPKLD